MIDMSFRERLSKNAGQKICVPFFALHLLTAYVLVCLVLNEFSSRFREASRFQMPA